MTPHCTRQPRRNGKWISCKAPCKTTAMEQPPVTTEHARKRKLGLKFTTEWPATAKKKPAKKIGSTARSKLVAYSKLVRRVREARVQKRGLHQEIGDRRRKYCEAAYRRRLTRRVVTDGGTVGEQLAGHRKAARKAYVKAGREFDLILRGPM